MANSNAIQKKRFGKKIKQGITSLVVCPLDCTSLYLFFFTEVLETITARIEKITADKLASRN